MVIKALESLLREDGSELDAILTKVETEIKVLDTKVKVHCYAVSHDGNERPRVKDLAKAVAARAMEYAIPRSEIKKHKNIMKNIILQ